jgi:transcription initiation factor TFIIH subunit 1
VFLFFILLCLIQLLCILTRNVHAPTDQIVNVRAAFAELNHGFRGWETRFSQASKSLAFFLSATSQSHYTAANRQKGRRCSARLNDSKRLCATRHPHKEKCVPLNQHFYLFDSNLCFQANFPPTLFRQLTTCQTAANEFLRQFWTSLYPPPTTTSSSATPSQNAAKAAKMAGYLSKTREKVEALVRAGQLEGVEPERVEVVSLFIFLFE